MDSNNMPAVAELFPSASTPPHIQGREEAVVVKDQKTPTLPLALQENEITELDVEVMLRVARDKKAESGRYKRTPKRLPTAEPAIDPK